MTVWDDLVGQDEAVAVLRKAAAAARAIVSGQDVPTGAMTHAWLFTGPPGSGRSVAARALAAALQCERPDDLGCGECSACHTVLSRSHPDVRSVVPDGLSISVAEMRAVVATAARRPALGRWQVVVIEDADRLTEAASDALLKVVEEPPARTAFLLCAPSTHPDDVTVTIQSRCRHITLRTPSTDAVAGVLRDAGIDPADASWAAQAAQGHVGRAKRLARDPDARARRAAVLAIPASLTSLGACLEAADPLVGAAEAEAGALSAERDAGEIEAIADRARRRWHGEGCDGCGTGARWAPFVTWSAASARGPPVLSVMPWTGRLSIWRRSTGTWCSSVRIACATRTSRFRSGCRRWPRQYRHRDVATPAGRSRLPRSTRAERETANRGGGDAVALRLP